MFKTKINPEELGSTTYEEYVAVLKKEVKKAQKYGRTNVIVLSNFKFACGTVSTMMVLGKLSGPLSKWYKKLKKERAVEKDFALGDCFFEPQDDGITKLHIALNDGKGKPDKMAKNGKKIFKKIGLTPNIFKGELPEDLVGEGEFNDTELELIEQEADESNDNQSLGKVFRQYTKAYKELAEEVIPRLKMPEQEAQWHPQHLDIARQAFFFSKSFLDKFEEVREKTQEKFGERKQQIEERQPILQKIAAKVKTMFETKATMDSSISFNKGEEVATVLNTMKTQLAELNQFLDQLEK